MLCMSGAVEGLPLTTTILYRRCDDDPDEHRNVLLRVPELFVWL